jgi:hypothetical protein
LQDDSAWNKHNTILEFNEDFAIALGYKAEVKAIHNIIFRGVSTSLRFS